MKLLFFDKICVCICKLPISICNRLCALNNLVLLHIVGTTNLFFIYLLIYLVGTSAVQPSQLLFGPWPNARSH